MSQSETVLSGDAVTARNVDLSSCDRELVQFPEAIQPHGVMLTVDEQSHRIVHASANCAGLLGRGPQAILGTDIGAVLGPGWRDLFATLHRMPLDAGPVNVTRESFLSSEKGFDLFAHRSGGLVILELEPAPPVSAPRNLYAELRSDSSRLQDTRTLREFFDLAVERIRAFTGYDRVMAYRFDPDGSGVVVAEARRDDLEPYLGLHYPATDIPAPARRLFSLSWVRHLPDVGYTPVPLLAVSSPVVTGPVDMSFANLRSVSVMYTGYLRNMGVHSTMVMPLMKEGRLWGLISAMHHAGPLLIPREVRMAAEFLAHTLSLLMAAKEDAELFARITAMKGTTDQLIQLLSREVSFIGALQQPETLRLLLGQVDATGVAVVAEDVVAAEGRVPAQAEIRGLAGWFAGRDEALLATDRLAEIYPPALQFAADASGLLAIRIAGAVPVVMLWFRPEQVSVVHWAGDPRKPVEVDEVEGMTRLRPRNSFALWQESVRGRARPWQDSEQHAVAGLARAISDIVVARAEKIARISRELDATRAELHSYAHATSSELKEHLRGIHHLTTSLHRRQADALDDEGRQQVAAILKIAQRMDSLVDALLEHAQIGRDELRLETVDLDAVVDETLQSFTRQLADSQIEVRRPVPLGRARCNREWVAEIFTSLIGNAIRFNDKPRRWIEIGIEAGRNGHYYVADNGIGIDPADQQLIFQMFRRVSGPEEFGGGTGIGLTLARKIVERHGGRIWVRSTPGEGSRFCFTLAPD